MSEMPSASSMRCARPIPIGIRELVSSARPRQANCYYSSSDAAFDDRYQASAEYERVARGTIALEGGWRVYSSGAGIALGLIWRRFLGLNIEWDAPRHRSRHSSETGWHVCRKPGCLVGHVKCGTRYGGAGCGVHEIVLNDQAPFVRTCVRIRNRRGAAGRRACADRQEITGARECVESGGRDS